MSFGSVLIGLGMLFLSLTVIVRPWRAQADKKVSPESRGLRPNNGGEIYEPASLAGTPASLEARRDAIYGALADLDFDRSIGKLNDDDCQVVRSQLMAQAIEVLRQLDTNAALATSACNASLESEVESLIRARRAANGARPARAADGSATNGKAGPLLGATNVYCTSCGSALKPDDHFCGKCGATVAGPRCPHCDAAVRADDGFCVRCGTPLLSAAAA